MTAITLKRQFITDATGQPVGVIVPLEEFAMVEALLRQQSLTGETEKIAKMEQAVQDRLFMADLSETMETFGFDCLVLSDSHAGQKPAGTRYG